MAEPSGSPTCVSVVSTRQLPVSIYRVKKLDQYKQRHAWNGTRVCHRVNMSVGTSGALSTL
jgi:hypothetical protein